jgi:hypothetical protein
MKIAFMSFTVHFVGTEVTYRKQLYTFYKILIKHWKILPRRVSFQELYKLDNFNSNFHKELDEIYSLLL